MEQHESTAAQPSALVDRGVWEVDCGRRPVSDRGGQPLWEWVACDRAGTFVHRQVAPQGDVNKGWIQGQILAAAGPEGSLPKELVLFRPEALGLVETAAAELGIAVRGSRQTPALKAWLRHHYQQHPLRDRDTGGPYDPLALVQRPPLPIAATLQGERWRFAALPAGEFEPLWRDRPVPLKSLPPARSPLALGLASDLPLPGIVIDAGRAAMPLARWLWQQEPFAVQFMLGQPDGAILEAGLSDRWILATSTDGEVRAAGHTYESRKRAARGLHFLLIRPDESDRTHTALWLLQGD
ncbi:MAG: Tab2/Atab2 family RNA-binding protein [Cyanophyceae cyanobacterium]